MQQRTEYGASKSSGAWQGTKRPPKVLLIVLIRKQLRLGPDGNKSRCFCSSGMCLKTLKFFGQGQTEGRTLDWFDGGTLD